jgi:hypothetical protein
LPLLRDASVARPGIDFDFTAETLNPKARWPPGLPPEIATVDTVPPLLWLHGDGIATFDVVAAIVMVLTEV